MVLGLQERPPPKVTPKLADRVKIYRDGTDKIPDNVMHKEYKCTLRVCYLMKLPT